MQISGLNASGSFSATDILAIEVNVNGVEKTYKLTGATLATALASIGSYLKSTDVVDNLTSTVTDKPLSAAQGKALNDAIKNTGVPITKGAKIGSFMAQCYVQSNVVLLSGYMYISAELQTNDVIATLTGISAVANLIRIPFFNNDGSGKMFFAKIAQNGNQILVDGTPNNTAYGQYYVFNFSFPATR